MRLLVLMLLKMLSCMGVVAERAPLQVSAATKRVRRGSCIVTDRRDLTILVIKGVRQIVSDYYNSHAPHAL